MTLEISLQNVLVLLTIQFAAFGWRINREITVGDQERKTWLPVPDIVNILSLLGVLVLCVVYPLGTQSSGATESAYRFPQISRIAFASAAVLIAFHPISMAGHYRLFSRDGRSYYTKRGRDYPYCTGQEAIIVIVSVIASVAAGWYVGH